MDTDAIVLGLPDIDWRTWNHNAEYLKTAAVLKSEQTAHQAFSALSCHPYAGSVLWFSQIPADPQNRKALGLYARLLSLLGCTLSGAPKNILEEHISAGLYAQKVTGMLYKPYPKENAHESVHPGLNRVEQGNVWRRISEGTRVAGGCMVLYVHSPQDRTDFLLNPDTVDMHVRGESETVCYINGLPQGQGTAYTVTSLRLSAGINRIDLRFDEALPLPALWFRRINGQKLDLKFRIYDRELKTLPMHNAEISSDTQPEGVRAAIGGPSVYWHSRCDQCPGVDLSVAFPSAVVCRALYFNETTDDHPGEVFTPRRFMLWAGDSPETLRSVYEALREEQMSYQDGKVFVRLDDITARCFKLVLLENALKPWIVSDLTFLT